MAKSMSVAVVAPDSNIDRRPAPRLVASSPPTVLCIEDDRDMSALIVEELESGVFGFWSLTMASRPVHAAQGPAGHHPLRREHAIDVGLEVLESLTEIGPRFAAFLSFS